MVAPVGGGDNPEGWELDVVMKLHLKIWIMLKRYEVSNST